MLEATRKKLREATFFLGQFAEQERRVFRPEPEARDFYLSGFLSAARSVADVIEAEEGDRYRAWFALRKTTLTSEEQELLKFTNRQRVQSVHVRGPEVQVDSINVPIIELQRELEAGGGSLQIFPGGVPGAPEPMPTVQRTTLVFQDSSVASVCELSQRYLEFITSIINEYELSTLPPNNALQPTCDDARG